MAGKRGNPGMRGRLLENSVEAYILALETINCLSIKYRVETFTYLLCNAWELLLKAKIITDTGQKQSIYYPAKPGEKRRTLALRDCLKRVIPDQNDPVRLNVETVADLRDEACHLIISKVPKEVLGLFQSSVLNYHRKLNGWFGLSMSSRVSVGMMTIVYDFKPEEFDLRNPRLRREMGQETAQYLLRYQSEIQKTYSRLGKVAEFSIDIDYHLAIIKQAADGDICLTTSPDAISTHIVEVPKDSGKTHPFRKKEVIQQVNARLKTGGSINTHDLLCVGKAYSIEKRAEFFYQASITGSQKQYSPAYVDWLVSEFQKNQHFFADARQRYKAMTKP